MGRISLWVELLRSFTVTPQTLTCLHFQVLPRQLKQQRDLQRCCLFRMLDLMNDPAPILPSKLLEGKKNRQCFPSRQQVTVLSAVCAYARVPACPRCRCAKRRDLGFGPMQRCCPLQVPLPPCRPGTRTLTVIGDCVLLSLHASLLPPAWPLPLLPCSTFIWPPLAAPGF